MTETSKGRPELVELERLRGRQAELTAKLGELDQAQAAAAAEARAASAALVAIERRAIEGEDGGRVTGMLRWG